MHATAALRTSSLIAAIADTTDGETVSLEQLLTTFRQRAFGVLLFVVLLPTFIPVPIGVGGVTGPLIALLGLQLLLLRPHPWLPRWLARRGMKRSTVRNFGERFQRVLGWLERMCRARLPALVELRIAHAFTGLQLVLLGVLLALPIPFTNYPYGLVLLVYCIALLERDGVLMLVAWILGIGAIMASALLSSEVVALLGRLVG